MNRSVHSSIIYNSQDKETTYAHQQTTGLRRCGVYICLCVCVYIYIYNTYILYNIQTYTNTQWNISHKKEWNIAICSNLYGPRDYHTKGSKSDRKTNIWYHLYVEPKIWYKLTYLRNRKRLTDIENKLMLTKGEKGGRDKLGVWD